MHDDPTVVVATVAAMIGGLVVFALLLLAGGVIVRWLKFPQDDLPEGPRHEPPPPAIRDHGDRAQAAISARHQAELQALYSRAHAVYTGLQEYQKIRDSLPNEGVPVEAAGVIARLDVQASTASASVLKALTEYDARLRRAPTADAGSADFSAVCEREGAQMTEAVTTLRATAGTLQMGGRRTKLWLLVIAVVLVLWLSAILAQVWH